MFCFVPLAGVATLVSCVDVVHAHPGLEITRVHPRGLETRAHCLLSESRCAAVPTKCRTSWGVGCLDLDPAWIHNGPGEVVFQPLLFLGVESHTPLAEPLCVLSLILMESRGAGFGTESSTSRWLRLRRPCYD